MLWTACKKQAAAENRDLKGEALMEKTAELFREVVYSSQVMDSTLTRSELMRSKTQWDKAMSAFMAEPTLSYNIILDAASQYNLDVREHGKAGAWQRNGKKIGKAFSVYLLSATFSALVESIADAVRDDDDEEFWEKFVQALWGEDGKFLQGNLSQDLTILGKLPYIKNFISSLQGYESGDMSLASMNNLLNAYKIWEETVKLNTGAQEKATKVTYYGKMTEWGKIYKTLQALSQGTGVAVSNLTRDVIAIWNTIMNDRNPEWKIRTYDGGQLTGSKKAVWEESIKPLGISKTQYQAILTDANEDKNSSVSQAEMDSYLKEELAGGHLTREQADAIWDAQGWKKTWDEYKNKGTGKSSSKASGKASGKTSGTTAGAETGYDSFKKTAPLHGSKKQATYDVWEMALQKVMSLERFGEILSEADANSNKSLTQDELGNELVKAVKAGEMTQDQAAQVWAAQDWSHDFSYWLGRHPH